MLDTKLPDILASSSGREMNLVMCPDTGPCSLANKNMPLTYWLCAPTAPYISIIKELGSLKVSSISSCRYEVSESQREGATTHMLRNDLGNKGEEREKEEKGDLECEGEAVCIIMGNCDKSPGESQSLPQ